MLTNSIILAINGCDTLRPLDTLFGPSANSILDSKYHKGCNVV